MRAQKFSQAARLLRLQIGRDPSDGDAWHALGAALLSTRATGWMDAHTVWTQGARRCPTHHYLSLTVQKMEAYSKAVEVARTRGIPAERCVAYTAGLDGRVALTTAAVLSTSACAQAIAAAEAFAANNIGWTTSRHYAVPTTDIPLHAVPSLLAWFAEALLPCTLRLLQDVFFAGKEIQCSVYDAFVVKYSAADGQRYLPLHSDESTHSITVALNDAGEFAGGGTFFQELQGAVRPPLGHVLAFDGNLLHAGDALLSGTRYIVAAFLLLAPAGEVPGREWVDMDLRHAEETARSGAEGGAAVCSDSGTFSFTFS